MINFVSGNIFESKAEAIVNAVNTIGVMGKGIALEFKKRYPYNFKEYKTACDNGELIIGTVLAVKETNGKTIVNFPTKQHWKDASKYEYVEMGLKALKDAIIRHNLNSIALPALGCGLGGLKWEMVKQLIDKELGLLAIEVFVYEPI